MCIWRARARACNLQAHAIHELAGAASVTTAIDRARRRVSVAARLDAPAMAVWLTLGALALPLLGGCLASDPIPPGVHPGGMSSDNCNHTAGTTVGNRFFWLPRNDTGRSGYIALAGDGHDGQKPGVPTMCLDASGGKEHLKGYTCGYPGCTGCQNQWFHFDTSDSSIRWDGGDGCLFQNDADGSPDHPEPFITMKMPCPTKVTDSAGQWTWGMNPPRTELDAAPIVNVKSNQCFSLSAGSGPPPGSTPSPGDAMVMVKCSGATRDGGLLAVDSSEPSPATSWVACTGEDCFAEGSYGATEMTAIKNNASGLCLDAAGGFPGWGARVMPCVTSQLPWFWGNNPTTGATWRVMSDGTLRTNISKAGSPINASGEACLFSSVPGNVSGNWWTSGQVGMWWCDGSPESKWKLTGGTLQAAAGVKSGMCLSSSPVNIPNPKPGTMLFQLIRKENSDPPGNSREYQFGDSEFSATKLRDNCKRIIVWLEWTPATMAHRLDPVPSCPLTGVHVCRL